jgi:hypothetical protein
LNTISLKLIIRMDSYKESLVIFLRGFHGK